VEKIYRSITEREADCAKELIAAVAGEAVAI